MRSETNYLRNSSKRWALYQTKKRSLPTILKIFRKIEIKIKKDYVIIILIAAVVDSTTDNSLNGNNRHKANQT